MYNSHCAGSDSWQSAIFPGRPENSRTFFLRVNSRARLAASLAAAASTDFLITALPISGFSSRYCLKLSPTSELTIPSTSELPSFDFVCPSNCGSFNFTDTTAVKPSRISSPVNAIFIFLRRLLSFA